MILLELVVCSMVFSINCNPVHSDDDSAFDHIDKVNSVHEKRITTEKMTTTKPPTEACGDKVGYCITIQFQTRTCSSKEKRKCPRSCEVCSGPKSEACLNFKDRAYNCMEKAEAGDCQNRNSSIRWITKMDCSRTCCERGELYKYPEY